MKALPPSSLRHVTELWRAHTSGAYPVAESRVWIEAWSVHLHNLLPHNVQMYTHAICITRFYNFPPYHIPRHLLLQAYFQVHCFETIVPRKPTCTCSIPTTSVIRLTTLSNPDFLRFSHLLCTSMSWSEVTHVVLNERRTPLISRVEPYTSPRYVTNIIQADRCFPRTSSMSWKSGYLYQPCNWPRSRSCEFHSRCYLTCELCLPSSTRGTYPIPESD